MLTFWCVSSRISPSFNQWSNHDHADPISIRGTLPAEQSSFQLKPSGTEEKSASSSRHQIAFSSHFHPICHAWNPVPWSRASSRKSSFSGDIYVQSCWRCQSKSSNLKKYSPDSFLRKLLLLPTRLLQQSAISSNDLTQGSHLCNKGGNMRKWLKQIRHPKTHRISKLVVWRSQSPAIESQTPTMSSMILRALLEGRDHAPSYLPLPIMVNMAEPTAPSNIPFWKKNMGYHDTLNIYW